MKKSYSVLPDDGCADWRPRALRMRRDGIDGSPTADRLRVRLLGRFQTVASPGTWELRRFRVVGDEDCANGADDNGDGLVDAADPICVGE